MNGTFIIIVIILILLVWLLYGPLTEGLFDLLQNRAVYHGRGTTRTVTLTFDDGPDPQYTPQLLDLLKQHEAKAVFFVLGKKAQAHPELIRRIQQEGHRLGNHTYHHVNTWFITPWRLRAEVQETNHILEEITGEKVRYFRPPWGRLNSWSFPITRRLGMETILWSLVAKDWRQGDQQANIVARLTSGMANGSIVLLHDAGDADGAPHNTVHALEKLLPRLNTLGLSCTFDALDQGVQQLHEPIFQYTRISQRFIIPLWLLWERLFDHLYHVYPLSKLFRLSVVPWRFGTKQTNFSLTPQEIIAQGARETAATHITPSDATAWATQMICIENGSPMVELHVQNVTLQEFVHIESPERMAVYSLKVVRESLHYVAQSLLFDERFSTAKGIFGMTLLHRGMDRLGFHVEEVEPTLMNRWVTKILVFIMVLYHPQGRKRLHTGSQTMRPKLIWMTKEELVQRYYQGELPTDRMGG